jgi:hypothetical protein
MTAPDLTPPEHEHSAAIDAAVTWLLSEPDTTGRPIIPEMKTRFGLTSLEACEACREASRRRAGR